MAEVKLKFVKYSVGGKTFYDLSPDVPSGQQEVTDPAELKQAEQFYQTNINDPRSLGLAERGEQETAGMRQRLADYQRGISSQFVINDQGVLAEQGQVAAQQEQQRAFAAGETINIGTAQAPLYVPKGTPAPEQANRAFQAKLPPPTYQEYNPKTGKLTTITPTPGTGTYVEDIAKGFDQPKTGLGSVTETNRLLGGQYFDPVTGKQLKPFSPTAPQLSQKDAPQKQLGATEGILSTPPAPTPKPVVGDSSALRAAERKQKIEEYKKLLETGAAVPAQFRSVEEFDRLRKEQGVVLDEQEMQAIQNEALQIRQSLREFASRAGEGVSEAGRIGAVSEAERNAIQRLESLAIREQAVVERLNTKNAYINNVLRLGQQDYNVARQEYEFEYNKNLKALNLLNEEMDSQKADALTAFTTISNLIAKKGTLQLTSQLRTQLETYALEAGLPIETIDLMLRPGADKVSSIYSRDEGIFAVMEGADGVPYVKQLSSAPVGRGKDAMRVSNIQSFIDSKKGLDGLIAFETYQQAAQNWISQGGTTSDFKVAFPAESLMDKGNLNKLPESLQPTGFKPTPTVQDIQTQAKDVFNQYKTAGYTRKQIEDQWKSENNTTTISPLVKSILDELYPSTGKWWEFWK